MAGNRRWTTDWGMMPLRLVVGVVFLMHGGQKLFDFGIAGVADMLQKLGFPMATLFAGILIAAELAGAVSILLGAFARWAGIALSVDMTIAILVARLHGGFFTPYGYEFELTLLGALLTIALVGPGGLSVDRWRARGAVEG